MSVNRMTKRSAGILARKCGNQRSADILVREFSGAQVSSPVHEAPRSQAGSLCPAKDSGKHARPLAGALLLLAAVSLLAAPLRAAARPQYVEPPLFAAIRAVTDKQSFDEQSALLDEGDAFWLAAMFPWHVEDGFWDTARAPGLNGAQASSPVREAPRSQAGSLCPASGAQASLPVCGIQKAQAGSLCPASGTPPRGVPEPPRVVLQTSLALSAGGGPVCFTDQPHALVQTVMLATKAAAADLATLIDVTVPGSMDLARLRTVRGGGPEISATESSLTTQFTPGTWQVITIDLPDPVPLDALHFGGTAGLPEWQRGWQGTVSGIVCFDTPPCADARAGTASLLALRGGFPGAPYRSTHAQKMAAARAGLKYGVDWATVIIIR